MYSSQAIALCGWDLRYQIHRKREPFSFVLEKGIDDYFENLFFKKTLKKFLIQIHFLV